MKPCIIGIVFKAGKILLNLDFSQSVQGYNVKVPNGFVVLRRVSCSHQHKALRNLMHTEGLILKKLQHGRRQCLRHRIDFIQKEDSFGNAGLFNLFINGGHNLRHGIFRNGNLSVSIHFLGNIRQSDGRLSGMVGNGIGNQIDSQLLCHLLHDSGFSDSRRSHQEQRSLPFHRNFIATGGILLMIGLHRPFDFFFCFFYIHKVLLIVSSLFY